MNRPTTPIQFETLLDHVEGRLPDQEAAAISQRLASADDAVRRDLAWLQDFQALQQSGALEAPPARLRNNLRAQFKRWSERRPAQPGIFQRLQAALSFDSLGGTALAGARDLQLTTDTRQLLFESDVADVELYLLDNLTGTRLLGQIMPIVQEPDISGWVVELHAPDRERQYAVTNDLGEFRFFDLPPGVVSITILAGDREIVLDPVDLAGGEQ